MRSEPPFLDGGGEACGRVRAGASTADCSILLGRRNADPRQRHLECEHPVDAPLPTVRPATYEADATCCQRDELAADGCRSCAHAAPERSGLFTLPRQLHSKSSSKRTPNDTMTPCSRGPSVRMSGPEEAEHSSRSGAAGPQSKQSAFPAHLGRHIVILVPRLAPVSSSASPDLQGVKGCGRRRRWVVDMAGRHACMHALRPPRDPVPGAHTRLVPAPRPGHCPSASGRQECCDGEPCCSRRQLVRGACGTGGIRAQKPSRPVAPSDTQAPRSLPPSTLAHPTHARSPGPLQLQGWRGWVGRCVQPESEKAL